MAHSYRARRFIVLIVLLVAAAIPISQTVIEQPVKEVSQQSPSIQSARHQLDELEVKGRAPKTGYSRNQFGAGWQTSLGCDTRNHILLRDLKSVVVNDECSVQSGTLHDPYTGKTIQFKRGVGTSTAVQIDHVVALSDAWQKGAQQLSFNARVRLANDPLNLLAVDGPANQQKSDGDAATWLPSNKAFRCQYVSRQIKVKTKYDLWVTAAEKTSINDILLRC